MCSRTGKFSGWNWWMISPVPSTLIPPTWLCRGRCRSPSDANYNSPQSFFQIVRIGYGWKLDYFPYLVLSGTNGSLIYAAEMDGSVIAYRQNAAGTMWTPQVADNPQLVNESGQAAGSVFNLFNNTITRTGTESNNTATYTLKGEDGSVRTFADKQFPLFTKRLRTPSVNRQRPYLKSWVNPQESG